jgi:hypothetical protein
MMGFLDNLEAYIDIDKITTVCCNNSDQGPDCGCNTSVDDPQNRTN